MVRISVRLGVLALVLALAGGLYAASLSEAPSRALLASGRLGPSSSAPLRPSALGREARSRTRAATDLEITFHFRVRRATPGTDLFQTGPANVGLRAVLSSAPGGAVDLVLVEQMVDGKLFTGNLGAVHTGRSEAVRIEVANGEGLEATLDHNRPVKVLFGAVEFEPSLAAVDVGTGDSARHPFDGTISDFRLSYSQRPIAHPSRADELLDTAAAAVFALAVLLALSLVSLLATRRREDDEALVPGGARVTRASPDPSLGIDEHGAELLRAFALATALFLVALIVWWALTGYFGDAAGANGLGFWTTSDRPGWLPLLSRYVPLVGRHFFGDFFQFYYLVKSHAPYSDRIFHTDLNPGYFIPPYLFSWLTYPAAGVCYLICLLGVWLLPAFVIGRRSVLLALGYLVGTTLTVPALMALDLGQPQVVLFVLALGALALASRPTHTSAVLLGVAIAIKPYMVLFAIPYLLKRRTRDAAVAIGVGIVLNLVMAAVLVGGDIVHVSFWHQILSGMTSYGVGDKLSIWGGLPFLHDNASLFALLDTVHARHVPVLSAIAGPLLDHYVAVEVVVGLVALAALVLGRVRLALEEQWLLLVAVLLLVPSYSLGYEWLLLLVPLGASAWRYASGDRTVGEAPPMRLLYGLVLLAVAAYPEVITAKAFASSAFGPNGNTVCTPVIVFVIAVVLVRRALTSRRLVLVAPGAATMGDGDAGLLTGSFAGLVLQILAMAACMALSSGAARL